MTQPYVTHIVLGGKRTHFDNWAEALAARRAQEERQLSQTLVDAAARMKAEGRRPRRQSTSIEQLGRVETKRHGPKPDSLKPLPAKRA